MAAVASSAVTINSSWTEADVHGKRFNCYNISIVLSTQGGATNNVPLTTIVPGLSNAIVQSGSFVKSDNSAIAPTSPDSTGTLLLFGTTVGDISGTYTGVVKGY